MRMPVDRKHPSKQPDRSGSGPSPPKARAHPNDIARLPPCPQLDNACCHITKTSHKQPEEHDKELKATSSCVCSSVWGGGGAKNTSVTKTTRSHLRPSVTLHVSAAPAWETGSKRTPDGKTQGKKESYIKAGIVPPSLTLCSDYQDKSWNHKSCSACIRDTNSQSLTETGCKY